MKIRKNRHKELNKMKKITLIIKMNKKMHLMKMKAKMAPSLEKNKDNLKISKYNSKKKHNPLKSQDSTEY